MSHQGLVTHTCCWRSFNVFIHIQTHTIIFTPVHSEIVANRRESAHVLLLALLYTCLQWRERNLMTTCNSMAAQELLENGILTKKQYSQHMLLISLCVWGCTMPPTISQQVYLLSTDTHNPYFPLQPQQLHMDTNALTSNSIYTNKHTHVHRNSLRTVPRHITSWVKPQHCKLQV